MTHSTAAPPTTRRALGPVVAVLVVAIASLAATMIHPSASSAPPPVDDVVVGGPVTTLFAYDGSVDQHDGALPDGVTVYDDRYPGITNLDPGLLQALRHAAMDAAADGVTFHVNSGWRSPEYQEQLLRDAVTVYGSEAEAARWVATVDTSAHVTGDAVDIGPAVATTWLLEHGARYGLCQVYGNEPWHYELHPEAEGRGCPPTLADATHDRRTEQ